MSFSGMYWNTMVKSKELSDGRMKVHIPEASSLTSNINEKSRQSDAPYMFKKVKGDFQVWLRVSGKLSDPLDQAGILIKGSKSTHMRCAIEVQYKNSKNDARFKSTHRCVSVGVTHDGISDTSNIPMSLLNHDAKEYWLSIERVGSIMTAYWSPDRVQYRPIRIAYFGEEEQLSVGFYGACPGGYGFKVVFDDFEIEEANKAENSEDLEAIPSQEETEQNSKFEMKEMVEALQSDKEVVRSMENFKQDSEASINTQDTEENSICSLDQYELTCIQEEEEYC